MMYMANGFGKITAMLSHGCHCPNRSRGGGGEYMTIIIDFVIPFCFGFIATRAFRNGDTSMFVVAIIGFIADLALTIPTRR